MLQLVQGLVFIDQAQRLGARKQLGDRIGGKLVLPHKCHWRVQSTGRPAHQDLGCVVRRCTQHKEETRAGRSKNGANRSGAKVWATSWTKCPRRGKSPKAASTKVWAALCLQRSPRAECTTQTCVDAALGVIRGVSFGLGFVLGRRLRRPLSDPSRGPIAPT